jgi:benzoyl-CoA reductase/2-hydroxyglutaryl-CoA dehydratase subunit BcrC/BadD/HgdB
MNEHVDLLKNFADQGSSIVEYSKKKYPERTYMFEFTNQYWQDIYKARENGIPIVLIAHPGIPQEMIYALGAVPIGIDILPVRLASGKDVFKYIDLGEKFIPSTICALDKVDLGVILSGDLGFKPDAFIFNSLPCDSGRTTYAAVADYLGVPYFILDTPYRKDEAGYEYSKENLKDAYEFLQKVLGRKHDPNKLAEVIKRSNEAAYLLTEVTNLRKLKPCPLPSRLLAMNGMTGSCMGSQYLVDYLRTLYEDGKARAAKKIGCTPGEEKYRVLWLQNMIWSSVSVMDWMENEFDAVSVMDSFGFTGSCIIDDPYNYDQVFRGLIERCLGYPMVHGAAGPAQVWLDLTNEQMEDYSVNLAMFAGHVGCKHTWAAHKIVKDVVEKKYGVPVLTFDLDSVDVRYKSVAEVKETIKEFMETLEASGTNK